MPDAEAVGAVGGGGLRLAGWPRCCTHAWLRDHPALNRRTRGVFCRQLWQMPMHHTTVTRGWSGRVGSRGRHTLTIAAAVDCHQMVQILRRCCAWRLEVRPYREVAGAVGLAALLGGQLPQPA